MTGHRKLTAFAIALAALVASGWLGFLTDVLMQGILGSLIALVGGNAAEHFTKRGQAHADR
jgi:hypothetical protein